MDAITLKTEENESIILSDDAKCQLINWLKNEEYSLKLDLSSISKAIVFLSSIIAETPETEQPKLFGILYELAIVNNHLEILSTEKPIYY